MVVEGGSARYYYYGNSIKNKKKKLEKVEVPDSSKVDWSMKAVKNSGLLKKFKETL